MFKIIDEGLVGIAKMLVVIIGGALCFLMPLSAIILIIADIVNKDWLEALEILGIGFASVYLGRAMLDLKK